MNPDIITDFTKSYYNVSIDEVNNKKTIWIQVPSSAYEVKGEKKYIYRNENTKVEFKNIQKSGNIFKKSHQENNDLIKIKVFYKDQEKEVFVKKADYNKIINTINTKFNTAVAKKELPTID